MFIIIGLKKIGFVIFNLCDKKSYQIITLDNH